MTKPDDFFFVGYLNRAPARVWIFLLSLSALVLALMAALAFAFGSQPTDPGDGRIGRMQTITGAIEAAPYPVLRALPTERHPKGRALMLSGWTKEGVQREAARFRGRIVDARGLLLNRGSLDMLNVRRRGVRATQRDLSPAQRAFTPAAAVPLGRWRLEGEICDGKCYAGVMKPGLRLSHKACANLCLLGGVPPVFVSTGAVEGTNFMLLANPNGGPLPPRYLDLSAIRIALEGELERRDDLLVFRVDLEKAEVL